MSGGLGALGVFALALARTLITLSPYHFITPSRRLAATAAQPRPTINNPRPSLPACLRARVPELYHLEKIGPARRKVLTMRLSKCAPSLPLTYQLSPRSRASGYQNRVHKNHECLIICPRGPIPHAFLSDRLITWGKATQRVIGTLPNPNAQPRALPDGRGPRGGTARMRRPSAVLRGGTPRLRSPRRLPMTTRSARVQYRTRIIGTETPWRT
jgi:hypothetical protein